MWVVNVKELSSQIPRYLYEDTTSIIAPSGVIMSLLFCCFFPNLITFVFVLFKTRFKSLKAS